jgi:hypothetical protein
LYFFLYPLFVAEDNVGAIRERVFEADTVLSVVGELGAFKPPFVLRLSKDERKVFQQNQIERPDPATGRKHSSLAPQINVTLTGRYLIE